mmetsp:Transcript_71857/g.202878  ORF Transcript_71857/g.202878 Transcript_71857/m.202878 type:complete len:460 (-) Transcript_71857:199-1578(-)
MRSHGTLTSNFDSLAPHGRDREGGLCVFVARRVALRCLERVHGYARGGAVGLLKRACGLGQKVEVVDLLNVEQPKTSAQVLVFTKGVLLVVAPVTADAGLPVDWLPPHRRLPHALAPVHVHYEGGRRRAGEDLQRPVQAPLAVVHVHGASAGQRQEHLPEPLRQEDGVGVHLHRPVVVPEPPVAHHPGPDRQEDVGVQRRLELAPLGAHEVAGHGAGLEPGCHLERQVAVDRILVAREEADALLELERQQLPFVAVWQHEGKAKQGLPWSGQARRDEPVDLCWLPGREVDVSHLRQHGAGPAPLEVARASPVRPCMALRLECAPLATVAGARDACDSTEVVAGVVHESLDPAACGRRRARRRLRVRRGPVEVLADGLRGRAPRRPHRLYQRLPLLMPPLRRQEASPYVVGRVAVELGLCGGACSGHPHAPGQRGRREDQGRKGGAEQGHHKKGPDLRPG